MSREGVADPAGLRDGGHTMTHTGRAGRRLAPLASVMIALALLLVGSRVPPAAGQTGEAPFASIAGPVGAAATPGRLYVTSPVCGNPRQVLSIDSSGAVSGFATLPARPDGCYEDHVAVAGPADLSKPGFPSPTKGGFPSNYVYVTQGSRILQITPDGAVSLFATITACGASHTGITFDRIGSFDYRMLVTCADGKVWKISATGTAALVADVAGVKGLASVRIENPEVAPPGFSPYGGHLFVAAETLGKVLVISPAGVVKDVASWPGAVGVRFIPDQKCDVGTSGGTFFTAIRAEKGPGVIVKFPLSAFAGKSGRALVMSGTGGGIGLLTSTGEGTIVPTLFRASIGKHEDSTFTDCSVPLLLKIIVKPGSVPHTINPRSKGTVPVAILSSPIFNAMTQIVLPSIRFGFTGTENSIEFCNKSGQDVNGDGRLDLICHGETRRLGIPGTGVYRGPLILKLEYIGPGGDPPGEGFD